jgi:hypothetical protein
MKVKIKYINKAFRRNTLALIETANTIIEDYQARGYELTLRQLYYQLVARDLIPNDEKSYNKLGSTISNARNAGLVDWQAIVDRTRSRQGLPSWNSPGDIIEIASRSFRIDKWQNQDYRIFVWVEKEALAGVIQRACQSEDIQVDYISCRGYMSASTIWREAVNLIRVAKNKQYPIVIHLGDHDPSGIDMTRDNIERLELYSGLTEMRTDGFRLERIALNYDQVEQYNPPPNPTKLSDTRANEYVSKFGYESWELDALDPDILVNLIQDKINSYKNFNKWDEMIELENEHKEILKHIAENWESI